MADFAFRTYSGRQPHPDDDVLSRNHAVNLRNSLKKAGHNAAVERSGGGEHRVYIKHPEHKDTVAYVNREEAPRLVSKDWEPTWIRK